MKKLLYAFLTSCCLISGTVFAENDCIGSPDRCYDYLVISLHNNTARECKLTSQSEIYGHLYYKTPLPKKLDSGAYASFIMVATDKNRARIRLTYECDDSTHQITLLSHSNIQFFKTVLKGTVENSVNMQAIITKQSLNSMLNGETEIDWDLKTID